MGKTELKYRTFDELMYEVNTDFSMYSTEGLIEPAQLIKVAQRVNYDLGMRIHGTKDRVLEIIKGKARLPEDFYVLNYALLMDSYKVQQPVMAGRQTEDVKFVIDPQVCRVCGSEATVCGCSDTFGTTNACGDTFVVVEKIRNEVKIFDHFEKLNFSTTSFLSEYAKRQGKAGHGSVNTGELKNGFLYTYLETGKVYINYEGALEDDEGNLLVLDHPMINEYYEYALKKRILENLYMNGEDVAQRIQLIEPLHRAARNNALSIVNTPDFKEMQELWMLNRKAQYHKFYTPFSSATNTTYK
jgi:hypothetical protein